MQTSEVVVQISTSIYIENAKTVTLLILIFKNL